MNVAILHEDGREVRITAEEYLSKLGARGGRSTWLTCPECGQPMATRAMGPHSIVSPYFKHEDDNPAAWECPNYSAGGDSYGSPESASLGEPVDLYIERTSYDEYSLQTLYPPLEPWVLEHLEAQGAIISIGAEEYAVNHENFSTDGYTYFYYEVYTPSFGLGMELHGASWPCDTPLPNIEHTLNGCMLFEALDEGNMAERLSASSIDSYEGDQFTMVFSTADGMDTALLIEGISTWFKVVGAVSGSQEGGDELHVAHICLDGELAGLAVQRATGEVEGERGPGHGMGDGTHRHDASGRLGVVRVASGGDGRRAGGNGGDHARIAYRGHAGIITLPGDRLVGGKGQLLSCELIRTPSSFSIDSRTHSDDCCAQAHPFIEAPGKTKKAVVFSAARFASLSYQLENTTA